MIYKVNTELKTGGVEERILTSLLEVLAFVKALKKDDTLQVTVTIR